ncbi:MAG TPA: aminotransferase class III-fold pyridoxal phosphate-dependent enzyme, partial [Leucothrix sp.]|nr:aminotransferase class III-fold pyridoxal phosphate-dependent enzyme [Leucothrix sp.]
SVFDQVFFANSGAEANEGAIKLARKWGQLKKSGAWKIISFEGGFHGRTLTTMSASGKTAFEPLFEPKTDGFIKVPYNDIEAVENTIDNQTVAIMLELIQGEAGVIPADPGFVKGLRALADKHKLLLIVDEIQTGIARTGRLFAYEHYAVEPDIMTLAKGLGGGVPIAALLAKEHCCVFDYGDQGGTFNGNPLMTAVANAIIEEISSIGFLESIKEKSNLLVIGLKKLSKEFGLGEVRGNGLLIALDTKAIDANELVNQALQKGLLINAPRINALRFMPALNVSEEEIEIMLSLLEDVLIGNINDPYC